MASRSGAVVQWLSLLHNFIQQSLNSGSAQVEILLAVCWRFAMVRSSDNGPGWNNHITKTIHHHHHHHHHHNRFEMSQILQKSLNSTFLFIQQSKWRLAGTEVKVNKSFKNSFHYVLASWSMLLLINKSLKISFSCKAVIENKIETNRKLFVELCVVFVVHGTVNTILK